MLKYKRVIKLVFRILSLKFILQLKLQGLKAYQTVHLHFYGTILAKTLEFLSHTDFLINLYVYTYRFSTQAEKTVV